MMKKKQITMICTIILLIICAFFGFVNDIAEQETKSEVVISQETSDENEKEERDIVNKIYNALYQKKSEKGEASKDYFNKLLNKLDQYEKKHPEDIRSILFLEAECNYRLNEFKEAFILYQQLRLGMESKDDPLYKEIEGRISYLRKKVKPKILKEEKKHQKKWWPIILLIGSLFIFTIYLVVDKKQQNKEGADENDDENGILSKNKLISLEEMREQDGRCSDLAMGEYKELSEEGKKDIADEKREKLAYAKLIFEGHEMIREMNKIFPYPINLILERRWLRTLSPYWLYTIVGYIFVLLWFSVDDITGYSAINPKSIYFLIAIFVISCLTGIHIMADKTINSIDEIVCMLEPHRERNSIKDLKIWIESLFRSPRQYIFSIIMMALIIIIMNKKNILIVNKGLNPDIIFISLLVLMASSIIWFLIGSLIMMNKIYDMKDLSINPLSPSKTIGLEKWISVIGTYNIVCSIVLTFGCLISVYKNYMIDDKMIYGLLWLLIIIPILIFCWIYPYVKIGSIVKTKKIIRMNFVKTKYSLLFNEWIKSENKIMIKVEDEKEPYSDSSEIKRDIDNNRKAIYDKLEDMERYYNVFRKIDESQESYFDFNSALELAKVMGFPSLFAIISGILSFYFY